MWDFYQLKGSIVCSVRWLYAGYVLPRFTVISEVLKLGSHLCEMNNAMIMNYKAKVKPIPWQLEISEYIHHDWAILNFKVDWHRGPVVFYPCLLMIIAQVLLQSLLASK